MRVEMFYNGQLAYTGIIMSYQPEYVIIKNDANNFLHREYYDVVKISNIPEFKPMNSDMSQGV